MRTTLLALAIALAAPATASAARTSLEPNPATGGQRVVYAAGAGEINDLAANLQGQHYTLQDLAGPPQTAVPPCEVWAQGGGVGTATRCPAAGVDRLDLLMGDGGDHVFVGAISQVSASAVIAGGAHNDDLTGANGADRVFGEDGNDRLSGRQGQDRLAGGPNDDAVEARDQGELDRVWCGTGSDSVNVDPADQVAADCELVNGMPRGSAANPLPDEPEPTPPGADGGSELPTVSAELSPRLSLRALLRRTGQPVLARCSERCDLELRMQIDGSLADRLGLDSPTIGRKEVTVDRRRRFTVRLADEARRALRGRRSLGIRLRTEADLAGRAFAFEQRFRLR